MDCSMPGFPVHHQLPELAQTHVHWVSDAIQPSNPLLSPSPSAFNLSQHRGLFKWISSSHQVAKEVLEFQLQHQSFQRIFRTDFLLMDWLDLLAVQGTLKSLLQHHSSKASILQLPAFFIVQLSHPYMTTGKTIGLTRQTFAKTWASLVAQRLKHLPAVWESWVRSLVQEDPLEKQMTTHSSIIAWRIPWTEEPGMSTGSQTVGHDWATLLTQVIFNFLCVWVCDKMKQTHSILSLPPNAIINPGLDACSSYLRTLKGK